MPLPEEAQALGLGAGTPVVLIVRFAFARDGVPVEVNEMTLDASRYLMEWEFPGVTQGVGSGPRRALTSLGN